MKTIVDYFRNLIMFIFLPIPLVSLDFKGKIGGDWNTWLRSPGHQTRAQREFSQSVRQLGWVWMGMFLSISFILFFVSIGDTSSKRLGLPIIMVATWFAVLTPQIMKSYQVWVWNEVNVFAHKMYDLSGSNDRNKCVRMFYQKKSAEAEQTGDYAKIKYLKHVLRVLDFWDSSTDQTSTEEPC